MKNVRSVMVAVVMCSGFVFAQEGPGGPHRTPPPESIQACSGLTSGTACGFTINGHNVTGTCNSAPDGATVACRPAHPGGHGPGRTPPKEALAACASSAASATCSFSLGDHSMSGTCEQPPEGTALACRPAGPPGGHHHGPPAEAVSACASLAANATCSFTLESKTHTGACETAHDGKTLACRAAGRGPPPAPAE
jgi:hypothetical protein